MVFVVAIALMTLGRLVLLRRAVAAELVVVLEDRVPDVCDDRWNEAEVHHRKVAEDPVLVLAFLEELVGDVP